MCDWQGCRAQNLYLECQDTIGQLDQLRDDFTTRDPGVAGMVSRIIACLDWKTMWLDEEPYTVWRLRDPVVAARMVERRDAMVKLGERPHRVTDIFVGTDSSDSLRADFERHGQGLGMSKRLKDEMFSYQMARVDDTWAEAAHRDITSHGKRKPASAVPFIAASQRLRTNVELYDSMDPTSQDKFHVAFRKCKAIGQLGQTFASKWRPKLGKLTNISRAVYRCDDSALFNWGA